MSTEEKKTGANSGANSGTAAGSGGDTFAAPAADNADSWTDLAGLDLAGLDADYAKAEVREKSNVPDGKYQVRVERASLDHTRETKTPMLKFDLVVISGQHKNRHIFKNSMLTANALSFLKTDLSVMGIELPKFSDLPRHLGDMLDLQLEVTVKTTTSKEDPTKEYNNVYFNRKITVPIADAGGEGPDETKAVAF